MPDQPQKINESKRSMTYYFISGLSMGSADAVPGVSGGTIALIMGIYEKLIGALASIQPHHVVAALKILVRLHTKAGRNDFIRLFNEISGWFLLPLLVGVVTAVISVVKIIKYLFFTVQVPDIVFGVFFGMILASIPIPVKMIEKKNGATWLTVIVFALAAYFLTGLTQATLDQVPLWYAFLGGAIAICAMILPGISGAFFLVVLGLYFPVTGALDVIVGKQVGSSGDAIILILVTVAGIIVGLFSFVRLLKAALRNYHDLTMAAVTGLMIGGLRALWPFKVWPAPFEKTSLKQVIPNRVPAGDDTLIYVAVFVGIAGLVLLELVGKRIKPADAH